MNTPELLSAMADGQLDEQDFAAALEACGQDDASLDCWNTYHLIGDFLRSPANPHAPSLAAGGETGFASRLSARIAQETVAPVAIPFAGLPASPGTLHYRGPASNDGSFRWKLVAGVASLAAVSAIAWNASGLMTPTVSGQQLAQSSAAQIVVTSPQGAVVRDARLEELLAAHRQFGTASALQESSGFLRNATFEMSRNAQTTSAR